MEMQCSGDGGRWHGSRVLRRGLVSAGRRYGSAATRGRGKGGISELVHLSEDSATVSVDERQRC
jgi:hypothetical protein